MYGLAVNLIMSVSGHPSIINEMFFRWAWILSFQACNTQPDSLCSPYQKTYLNFRLSSCGWFLTYKQMRCWYELRYEEVMMMRCPKFSRSLLPLASIANTKISK